MDMKEPKEPIEEQTNANIFKLMWTSPSLINEENIKDIPEDLIDRLMKL